MKSVYIELFGTIIPTKSSSKYIGEADNVYRFNFGTFFLIVSLFGPKSLFVFQKVQKRSSQMQGQQCKL